MTATPTRDRTWTVLHEAFERVADRYGEPVVLSTLAHEPGEGHPHTRFPFVLGPPGRLVAMAVGLRAALAGNPLLLVGAADAVTIGTNHLIHAARRNIGMTLVLLRDDLFDRAEASSLDRTAYAAASAEPSARPLEWATALGATYVGRASLLDPDELAAVLDEAVGSRGFAVVGVTNDPSLPSGALSRQDWPEFFGVYRSWTTSLPAVASTATPEARPVPAGAPDRLEVRIAGLGGQGVKLAGTVLSESAGAEGLWATQIGDYGSATRGGASSVDVVIGSRPITYPGADHPEVFVALSPGAAAAAPEAAALVVDDRVSPPAGALALPIVSLARQHTGGQLSAGIVALGVVAALGGWPSIDALAATAARKVPGKVAAANVAAMREAYEIVTRRTT